MQARTRPAFTLIELLVVISIIALLIGILLPALGAARNVARISLSASNQRQIGIAMAAYRADNNAYFPYWQQSTGGTPVDGTPIWYWTTRLAVDSYIPSLGMYADPAFEGAETPFLDPGNARNASSSVTRLNMDDRRFNRVHYGYNFVHVGGNYHQVSGTRSATSVGIGNPRANLPNYVPARMEDMGDPTSVMVTTGVSDFVINGSDPSFKDGSGPSSGDGLLWGAHVVIDISLATIGNAGQPHARYNDSFQNMWADGHVSTVSATFTEEEQNKARQGNTTALSLAYSSSAMGDIRQLGGVTRQNPNGDAGQNYFDLIASSPASQ